MSYIHPKVRYTDPNADTSLAPIKYIGRRVLAQNKNFLCAVTGQTGSGKSWVTGSIGEHYSKMWGIPFDPELHCFFNLRQLLEVITNKEQNQIKTGTFLMFDESQIEGNARSWQSESNKILSSLISTFRNQRLVVFFPTPKLEFLDRQSRLLFHCEMKVKSFDKVKKITRVEPRFLTEFNYKKDDFYRKRLIVELKMKDKPRYHKIKVNDWYMPKPSDEWIKIYEGKKKEFTDILNKKLLERARKESEALDVKEKPQKIDIEEFMSHYAKHGENYVALSKLYPSYSINTLRNYIGMAKKSNIALQASTTT